MSGSTHTTINFDKAGDDLPTANSNIRDRNRGDNSTSSSVSYDNRPVGNGRTNDNGDGRGAWRNNDNRENEGIIAGNNSTNSLYNGPHSGANMLENASYVTVNKSTLTNVSGISNNVSFNPGPRNAATDRKTNGRGNRPTAGDNDTESGANDVGGRQNFPGTGRRPSDDTFASGEMATTINNAFHDTSYEGEMRNTDNSNSGPDGRTNTGDWSRNDNRGNTGVIAGNGSKNAVNNGPSITATMFENGSRITFNGGSYHNVAGRNNTVYADGHPTQGRTM